MTHKSAKISLLSIARRLILLKKKFTQHFGIIYKYYQHYIEMAMPTAGTESSTTSYTQSDLCTSYVTATTTPGLGECG